MKLKKSLALLIVALSPILLIALPQDLEIFEDFENISGEGTIFIGQEPNVLTLVGFTVETLEDPAQLHSGTKALTPWSWTGGNYHFQQGDTIFRILCGRVDRRGQI